VKFRKRAFIVALLAFGAAFAGQLALRTLLGNKTLFSPDAVLAISFGAEAGQEIAWQAHVGGFFAGLVLFTAFDPARPPVESSAEPSI